MSKLLNERHQRVYQWLMGLGGDMEAVNFLPYDFLRKSGCLATQDAAERLKGDLVEMEKAGWILIGPTTIAGYMVMLTNKLTETLLLPFERMVAMHALMSDVERTMLSQWEKTSLGLDSRLATSDWPGWSVVVKRLSH